MLIPIYKFNNSNKATLCNDCRTIIAEDYVEELYCDACKEYRKNVERAIRSTLVVLNKQSIGIAVDKIVKLIKNE